ncbi:Monooxygenase FAD-binding [Penicillium lagena]|uniref:Monooxygenase FAD-binding n=1 Tax=Penicillium lagena TaxID=94218 RepID=UPI0025415B42|nr:Monooxygenase FAD-binding [Penicillium lagena]KAJ5620598.1 Monooxygenase FAD-binding [Penicillium lagena]
MPQTDAAQPLRDIIIVGAGLAGVSCAISLCRELTPYIPDLKIKIIERNEVLSTSGGAINLNPAAQRHLAYLGVLDELDRMGTEGGADVDEIELFSMHSGRSLGCVDFKGQDGNGYGGHKGRRVMRIVLLMAMINLAERTRNIEIVYGKKLIGGEEINDKAVVHFQDGSVDIGDLVIGCDGVHSATRTRWVDPDRPSEYTGISFLQAVVQAENISSYKHFRSTAVNFSQHGALLMSYCDRDREEIFASAMMEFDKDALHHYRLEREQSWATKTNIQAVLREIVRKRFRKAAIPCILEMVNKDADWMLYPIYQVPPGGQWHMSRVILLGDAAHAMPPWYSSTSFALDDAICFSRILARYRLEPLGVVFDIYDRLRRETVNNAFKGSGKMCSLTRDIGLLEEWSKEWKMPFRLRKHRHGDEEAWKFDATKIAIPKPADGEKLMTLHSFLEDYTM